MAQVTREGERTLRINSEDLTGELKSRIRNTADKIGSVEIEDSEDGLLRLSFGTVSGADKMMEMIANLT